MCQMMLALGEGEEEFGPFFQEKVFCFLEEQKNKWLIYNSHAVPKQPSKI